jgi:hypothetical protein
MKATMKILSFAPALLTACLLLSAFSMLTAQDAAAPAGDHLRGKDLFVGNQRFANGGATCNSCHNVDNALTLTGGALAKDLTTAFSRLTGPGLQGIISGMPFPQMKESYKNKPLTDAEIADLVAFLKFADEESKNIAAGNVGSRMIISGIAGALVLLGLFSFFWLRRKNKSVNEAIYQRQIKSA